jgi:Cdc6-like AAA superfamily ATPase
MDSNQELAKKLISNGHNLVLAGQEGTGKTYTIQSCYEQLRISGKRVQLTCYTGIACRQYHLSNSLFKEFIKLFVSSDGSPFSSSDTALERSISLCL